MVGGVTTTALGEWRTTDLECDPRTFLPQERAYDAVLLCLLLHLRGCEHTLTIFAQQWLGRLRRYFSKYILVVQPYMSSCDEFKCWCGSWVKM